jgi:hypothetical protein
VVGVVVVEGRADVLPVVGERRGDILLGGDEDGRVGRQVEEGLESIDRQQLGDVRAVLGVLERGDLGQLAMLGRELGGGRDLDRLGLAQAALGEGGEEADRLDLDVEEVDAHRAVLGGRVEVEDAAADGELPAVVDLVDALVARGHELLADLVEVEQIADADGERVRAQRRVGHLLAQRHRADHDDRRLRARGPLGQQGVEGGHAQADQVRRRREVRLVGHAAAGVEAHRSRLEPRPQVGGEVAGLAVVAGHHERRAVGMGALGQRRDEVGPHRLRHERTAAIGDEGGAVGVLGEA